MTPPRFARFIMFLIPAMCRARLVQFDSSSLTTGKKDV
jgi:hypothetical protein